MPSYQASKPETWKSPLIPPFSSSPPSIQPQTLLYTWNWVYLLLTFPIASVLGRPSSLLATRAVRVSCQLFISLQFLPLFNLSITRHFKVILFKSVSVSVENPSKSPHCFQHELEASLLWPDFCFPFGLIFCHLQTSWKQRLSTLNCMRFLKSAGLCSAFYEWSVT